MQPGKSYHAIRTDEFNWRTLETPYVIASIEAPSKSGGWRSKFVIFHTCITCLWNFIVALCRADGPGPFVPCLILVGGTPILLGDIIQVPWICILNYNDHTRVRVVVVQGETSRETQGWKHEFCSYTSTYLYRPYVLPVSSGEVNERKVGYYYDPYHRTISGIPLQ